MFKNKYFLLFGFQLIFSSLYPSESHVTPLQDGQFENFIQNVERPVIVDFWAPWCPPCKTAKPIFEELASELHEQYLFVSVDLDHGRHLAEQYGVEVIPTILVLKDKNVLGKFNGCAAKETLAKNIDNAIHQKLTLETLFSAVQCHDKELVAACLENENIDVNGILHFEWDGLSYPQTPLLMAVSKVIFGQATSEIVSLLLQGDASVDMEIDSTLVDKKTMTIRSFVEEMARLPSQENFASFDEAIKAKIVEMSKKASSLLELFPLKNASDEG